MVSNLIGIITCVLFGGFAACVFMIACGEKAQRNKELKEAKENAKKTADKITEANEKKAGADTGDNKRDFMYMADKLHEYARH